MRWRRGLPREPVARLLVLLARVFARTAASRGRAALSRALAPAGACAAPRPGPQPPSPRSVATSHRPGRAPAERAGRVQTFHPGPSGPERTSLTRQKSAIQHGIRGAVIVQRSGGCCRGRKPISSGTRTAHSQRPPGYRTQSSTRCDDLRRHARRDLTRRLRLTRRSSAVGYRGGRAWISALKEHSDTTPAEYVKCSTAHRLPQCPDNHSAALEP